MNRRQPDGARGSWAVLLAGAALFWAGVGACTSTRLPVDVVAKPAEPAPAEDLVYLPPGQYDRGDSYGTGYPDERPVHRVAVRGFFLGRAEVTRNLWKEVQSWAVAQGYEFEDPYDSHPEKPGDHPICNVSWYDAVKWANARSEKEGYPPVYYTDATQTRVYRRGRIELPEAAVQWRATGYRLPTEAEWEWAARGGLEHQQYPWPSPGEVFTVHLDGRKANYWLSEDPFESDARCATSPVAYFQPRQNPEASDMANGFGLYDLAGNVAEWCWDWYDDHWYERPGATAQDNRGPTDGYGRVLRGGSWISSPKYCRVSARYMSAPDYRCHCYGLRVARSGP
jgi:formylglycine-generating enzyme required for sulfatase activity